MSARQPPDALSHDRQASQLRDQLQGLLPDRVKHAADTGPKETGPKETGDGMRTLLDYAQLAAEYQAPIVALLQRLLRRAPAAVAEAAPAARRRFGVRPLVAVGVALGLGLAVYGVARAVQDLNRDA